VARPEARRVTRPPYEQLIADVWCFGYVATGRKYGVSDNAVRKWIRWYERDRADAEGEERKPRSGPAPLRSAAHGRT
jgi:transposase-like protein